MGFLFQYIYSYRGEETVAKLVMIEVDILSGFLPVKSSLKKVLPQLCSHTFLSNLKMMK